MKAYHRGNKPQQRLARDMSLLYIFVLLPVVYSATFWDGRRNETCVTPPNAVNTTERLVKLREQFELFNISAYIVTSNDEHQSEYVAKRDERRQFISGFTGSAGTAVITERGAALWTDSRYYIQASHQLDCNWKLMQSGEPDTPGIVAWLAETLDPGSIVSADAKTTSFLDWEQWRIDLEKNNMTMLVTSENLVDLVWGPDQPPLSQSELYPISPNVSGEPWQQKLKHLLEDMKGRGVNTLILTALDEIAWTLNLRGSDVPFTPVFTSYLVIESNRTSLYTTNRSTLKSLLNPGAEDDVNQVLMLPYENFWADLEEIGKRSEKIGLPTRYSYAQGVSYLLHTMLPADKIVDLVSPALVRKDTKNDAEVEAMRTSHIFDGTALCVFFAQLSASIASGDTTWTELRAVQVLDGLRWQQPSSLGPSFATIAAVGVNAAMPHYEPTNETDRPITTTELFLVDSGGQYYGGTTDVTRTLHFGQPRTDHKNMYTRLLMGCIDLATAVFPEKKTMNELEILVRQHLYALGLDYGHGSTHGIGAMLSVHEAFNTTYHPNFYGSQEPGFYKENDYGMRLENIVRVIPANTTSGANNYLTFETVTLVPYDRKLIDVQLLEKNHINWINKYHKEVESLVGAQMLKQGFTTEHAWLLEQTKPLI